MKTKTPPTEEMLEGIKRWLKLSKKNQSGDCPFSFTKNKGVFCIDHFKGIVGPKEETSLFSDCYYFCKADTCPCNIYSLAYVTRQAKHFIKIYDQEK